MNNYLPEQMAAWRFSQPKIVEGFKERQLHVYRDLDGQYLYSKICLKNRDTGEKWIRPMHYCQTQKRYVLGEPAFLHGKPLYNLPALNTSNLAEALWLVEGETCADRLNQLGLIATTSGGAESVNTTDWQPLANRHIILWRDNDSPGLKYAEDVTVKLQALNCGVEWIDVEALNLSPKADCVDWLNLHPEANKDALLNLPRIKQIAENKNIISEKNACHSYLVLPEGIYYVDGKRERHWICSELRIKAWTRDNQSENWGRLLTFEDADRKSHQWVMPMEMLKGSGDDVKGELLRQGLEIAPGKGAKFRLLEYITTTQPESASRARCVSKTGWFQSTFILPHQTIGPQPEIVVYQGENFAHDYQQAGTLSEWQHSVASLCSGNSRLLLAVSSAFAAMILHLAGMESGGIHLVGTSSSGKTTALRAAASVFGPPIYVNRWRATTNGLEALAALRSDTLLILDEMAQVDPREAGEIAYMLANGNGKARASKTGAARPRYEWRTLFLSAGEITLSQHMREAGKKARAGQEVRLVDIPADAGLGLGLFEELHGAPNGAALSQQLLEATTRYFGTPAIAFLETITQLNNFTALPSLIKKLCEEFIAENLPAGASGQVHRTCQRFAIIAIGGELATRYGITGWQVGEAEQAAIKCFKALLEQRGTIGNQEDVAILSQIQIVFEAHGSSRFEELLTVAHGDKEIAINNQRIMNRLGYRRLINNETEYYVFPQAFREEFCKGFEPRYVAQLLINNGMLKPTADGKPLTPHRINGAVKKFYHFIQTEIA